jgi:hypothetical protein
VRDEGRALALEARRRDVEQGAAADRDHRRVGADHEAIVGHRHERRFQPKARERRLPGDQLLAVKAARAP